MPCWIPIYSCWRLLIFTNWMHWRGTVRFSFPADCTWIIVLPFTSIPRYMLYQNLPGPQHFVDKSTGMNLYNPHLSCPQVYNASELLSYCEGFFLQNLTCLLGSSDGFRKLLFSYKMLNYDLVNGLLATLSQTLEDRLGVRSSGSTLVWKVFKSLWGQSILAVGLKHLQKVLLLICFIYLDGYFCAIPSRNLCTVQRTAVSAFVDYSLHLWPISGLLTSLMYLNICNVFSVI